mgnify:CR=1 FL=1
MRWIPVFGSVLVVFFASHASASQVNAPGGESHIHPSALEMSWPAQWESSAPLQRTSERVFSRARTGKTLFSVGLPMFAVIYTFTIIGGIYVNDVNEGDKPAAIPLSMIPCLGPALLFGYTGADEAPAGVHVAVGLFTALQTTGFVLMIAGLDQMAKANQVSARGESRQHSRQRCIAMPWGHAQGAGIALAGTF